MYSSYRRDKKLRRAKCGRQCRDEKVLKNLGTISKMRKLRLRTYSITPNKLEKIRSSKVLIKNQLRPTISTTQQNKNWISSFRSISPVYQPNEAQIFCYPIAVVLHVFRSEILMYILSNVYF